MLEQVLHCCKRCCAQQNWKPPLTKLAFDLIFARLVFFSGHFHFVTDTWLLCRFVCAYCRAYIAAPIGMSVFYLPKKCVEVSKRGARKNSNSFRCSKNCYLVAADVGAPPWSFFIYFFCLPRWTSSLMWLLFFASEKGALIFFKCDNRVGRYCFGNLARNLPLRNPAYFIICGLHAMIN